MEKLFTVFHGFKRWECFELQKCYHDLLRDGYIGNGRRVVAGREINGDNSVADYITGVCRGNRGNIGRAYRRALSSGYAFERFRWENWVEDIVEINHSRKVRSGGPMRGEYTKSVHELGGFQENFLPLIRHECNRHWTFNYGVFERADGRKVCGEPVNKRLLAYTRLRRIGNSCHVAKILGHGDHLKDGGLMIMLWIELVSAVMSAGLPFSGIGILWYGAWSSGGEGLQRWKKRVGLSPYKLIDFEAAND